MAKRKNKPARQTGLEPNQKCPYCGLKVKNSIKLSTGYLIEHWWSRTICKSVKYPTKTEQIAIAQLKQHRYTIKDVANERQ